MAGLFQRAIDRGGASVRIDDRRRAGRGAGKATCSSPPSCCIARRCGASSSATGTRAGFCLMAACQDCWVRLADGRRLRACSTPVEPGMAVIIEESALAEPIVVIVGAGPAGVRAAEALARAGVRPIVFDEAERPGGQIYRQPPTGAARARSPAIYGFEAKKAAAIHRVPARRRATAIDYRPRTLVWNVFGAAPRPAHAPKATREQPFDRLDPRDRRHGPRAAVPGLDAARRLHARRRPDRAEGAGLSRSAGASPSSAPGRCCRWSRTSTRRPASTSSRCSMRRRSPPSSRSCPGLLRVGRHLREGPLVHGAQPRCAASHVRYGVRSLRVEGDGARRGARLARARRAKSTASPATRSARRSACARKRSSPTSPAAASPSPPTRASGCPSATRGGRSSVAGVYLAGDGAGIGGADVAELQGRRTALAVLEDLGRAVDRARDARARSRPRPPGALSPRPRRRLSVSRPSPRRCRRRRDRLPLRGHHRRRRCARRRATAARARSTASRR